jgi:VanZ like family
MRKVLNFLVMEIGKKSIALFVWAIFLAFGLIIIRFALKAKSKTFFIIIFTLGIGFAMFMPLPEERVHIIKFGILGMLLSRDFSYISNFKSYVLPILLAALVAALDEFIQYFVPGRVADYRDVIFGIVGAIWGVLLYLTQAPKQSFSSAV